MAIARSDLAGVRESGSVNGARGKEAPVEELRERLAGLQGRVAGVLERL